MSEIGIGIVGGGYMGKAHAVAFRSVGAQFDTALKPRLEMVAASSLASAQRYRDAYGFHRAAPDWQTLVDDPRVDAVVVATPADSHRAIAEAALAHGKAVLCEKPLADTLENAEAMVEAAARSSAVTMVGFNYVQTPGTQYARQLVHEGAIGNVTWFRAEHTEDFYADPQLAATWRAQGVGNGALGDLAPHIINATLAFMGPIASLCASVETVHAMRPGEGGPTAVTNDDQLQFMCRFANGAMGHVFVSRVATGRKMGYIYEIFGTAGAIRFDQEDQNALWLYRAEGPEAERGFKKILTGPAHPDYLPFCQGPGHGTGYQDQIVIEASHFLRAIATGTTAWPSFEDGLAVSRVAAAVGASSAAGAWVNV